MLVREVVVGGALALLTLFGMKRFDVTWVGKAGTFALMFAFPRSCSPRATRLSPTRRVVVAWVVGLPGLVLSYYAAVDVRAGGPPGAPRRARSPTTGASTGRTALVKAVIMAGGEGTRLRPLTSNPPSR